MNKSTQQTDRCPCGCGRMTAVIDTNPHNTGSRPFISQDGLKIWLADWNCVERATRVLERNVAASAAFKSRRTNTLSV